MSWVDVDGEMCLVDNEAFATTECHQSKTELKNAFFPRAVTIVKYHEIKITHWPKQAKHI